MTQVEITAAQDIVDECTYQAYRYNRKHSPEIPVEDWTIIFGQKAYDYERRYQAES